MNTVKLQGVYNAQPAKAVKDLKIGDIITWNYGYKSEVVELIPSKSGKTVTVMLKSHETGKINPRKMRAVAVWYVTYCHMSGQNVFWKDEDDIKK